MSNAELVLDAQAFLGEGPLWDVDRQKLWWINIFAGELHCFDPATQEDQVFELGHQIGTVVLQESGGVAVALENGFHSFDPQNANLELIVDPESDRTENRFNDGNVTPPADFGRGRWKRLKKMPRGHSIASKVTEPVTQGRPEFPSPMESAGRATRKPCITSIRQPAR